METCKAAETIIEVPVGDIAFDPKNDRKTMDPGKFGELTASIKAEGVHTPIWIRTRDEVGGGIKTPQPYMLIAGERRLRAAIKAGRDTVPAIVKSATDSQARILSIIENDQREDVNPMEQAVGYKALLDEEKFTPETLAQSVGKKVPYVLARLKLITLPKEAQAALLSGKILLGHALVLTRLKNSGDQKELLKDILDEVLSVENAQEQVRHQYGTRLAAAPFDVKTICITCPSRSKNQAALFPEALKETDECLDRSCYFLQVRTHYQALAKSMADKGVKVLTDAAAVRKAEAAGAFEISADPNYSWQHPKKYKSLCAPCPNRAFACYEEGGGGQKRYEIAELCLDKKCFNKMNGRADTSGSGTRTPRTGKTYASRVHDEDMRDRFLRARVPAKVQESESIAKRLNLFLMLCQFERLDNHGKPDLKKGRDEVMRDIVKSFFPAWKNTPRLDEDRLYAAIARIPAKKLDAVLRSTVNAIVPYVSADVLLQVTPEAGIDLKRDFLVDRQYLNTRKKTELATLARDFKIQHKGAPVLKAEVMAMKKSEILNLMLAQKLTGKLPADIEKLSAIIKLKK